MLELIKELSSVSKASQESDVALTDEEVASWKVSFANSNPKREEGELDKYNFIALVLKVKRICDQ